MAWEILITDEVDAFLNELYESDRDCHKLVNQAVLVLEQNGPAAVLLVAGDKSGQWARWYRSAIPRAEELYAGYLIEREKEMDDERRPSVERHRSS